MSTMKFSITLAAATLAELYSSAAEFAALGGSSAGPADADDDAGPVNTAAPAFDSAGIPWDERIHSGTKGTNADGTWKRRRNTPDAKFNAVMEELKARGVAPTTTPPPAAPAAVQAAVNAATAPAPAVPPAPQFVPGVPPTTLAPMVAPMNMTAPAPAPQPEQPAGMQFGDFMPRVNAAIQGGRFTMERLTGEFLPAWQLQNVGQLAADPVTTLAFYNWLKNSALVD
jgi:hypothetical protein